MKIDHTSPHSMMTTVMSILKLLGCYLINCRGAFAPKKNSKNGLNSTEYKYRRPATHLFGQNYNFVVGVVTTVIFSGVVLVVQTNNNGEPNFS